MTARRSKELLVIIRNIENQEDAEWMEDDLVDSDNLNYPSVSVKRKAKLVSLKEHLDNPWENTMN